MKEIKNIGHYYDESSIETVEHVGYKGIKTFKNMNQYDYLTIRDAYLAKGWELTGDANTSWDYHTFVMEYNLQDKEKPNCINFTGNSYEFFELAQTLYNTGYKMTESHVDEDGDIHAKFIR